MTNLKLPPCATQRDIRDVAEYLDEKASNLKSKVRGYEKRG